MRLISNTVGFFYICLALTCSSEYFKSTIMRVLFVIICRSVITPDLKQTIATLGITMTIEASIYISMRSQSELFVLQK